MERDKRASMREGPLAALFRRTEEDGLEASAEDARRTPPREEGSAAAPREPEPIRPPEPPDPPEPAGPPEETEDKGASVPSPRERLRHAFSAEIPENVMEPAAPQAPAARGAPGRDDAYARSSGDLYGEPRPVGSPLLRVVGVGGAGVNAVNRMVEAEVEGVEFLGINTDLQSLQQCAAHVTLHIGSHVTRGLGSGSDPELGRQAAMEDYDKVKALLKGADMVFVTAGAGGGTGTGAAPVVARIARELGALTVGIVTRPFGFEGSRRKDQADEGVRALAEEVDTLIVVPNDRLLSVLDKNT